MSSPLEVTRAYLALGEALRNVLEDHDRAVHERDEALRALAQLQETDRARQATDDMNRDPCLADLLKGFKVGDLVRSRAWNKSSWGRVFKINRFVEVAYADYAMAYNPDQLIRKPVAVGSWVRTSCNSYQGRVETIQRNEIGIAHVWFHGEDTCVRLDECIAIEPQRCV